MTRKLFAVAAVAVVAGLAMPAAVAQSLDEIIAKHIEARGGKAKMDTVKTARASGRMSVGPGMEAPFSIFWKTPTMVRMEFTIQGMTGIQAYDGTTGWSVMPFMGKTEPEKMSDEDLQNVIELADWEGPLVNWKAKGNQVELVGKEAVEGTQAWKIKITRKDGEVSYKYLDADAYLEIKEEGKRKVRGQEMEFETSVGDYKDVSGLMLAHSMESKAKGTPISQTMTIDKIEINPDLAESSFHMPEAKAAASDPAKK
jgi:outer membrane lipoprotein-sorting protein